MTNCDPLDPQHIIEAVNISNDTDIAKVCRICLAEHLHATIPLFTKFDGDLVAQMLTYCTSLEIDELDSLPKTICELCFQKLKSAKELKERSIASDDYLRNSLAMFEDTFLKKEEVIQTSSILQIKLEPIEMLSIESIRMKDEEIFQLNDVLKEESKKSAISKSSIKKRKTITFNKVAKRTCAICNSECSNNVKLKKHWLEVHAQDRECRVCSIEMTSAQSLHHHLLKHNQDTNFSCNICNKSFSNQRSLKAHKLTHLSQYLCDLCNKTFTTKYSLITHIKVSHLQIKQYSCDECNKNFNQKNSYDMHLISNHGKVAPMNCKKCKMGFLFASQLKTHDREIHQSMKRKRPHHIDTKMCQICKEKHETSSKLAQHLKYQHANDRKCEKCQMTLGCSKELNRHLLMHDRKQIHICHFCGKSTKSADALIAHQGTHKVADFSCDVCGVKVKQKKSLCKHIESVHLKLGHVNCPDCQSRFKSVDAMRYHRISKHNVPAPIICIQCNKGFLYISQLNVHEFEHHLKIKIQRNYTNNHNKCDICNRVFWRSSHLQKHQELHKQGFDWVKNKADGVKPLKHKCKYCDKAFHNRWLLDNHHRHHTGEKPFKCEICGSRYSLTKTLNTHQKNVHKIIKPGISMKTHYFPEDPSEIGKPRDSLKKIVSRAEIK